MNSSSPTRISQDPEPQTRKRSAAELRSRNLRTLAALAALFFLPLVASFWLYYGTAWRPTAHVNYGELISPPQPLPAVNLPLVPLDGISAAGEKSTQSQALSAAVPALFHGKWTLVYIGDGSCDEACRQALLVMRQTRLALGTDMTRISRAFLVSGRCCARDYLARQHAGLVVLDATGAQGSRLLGVFPPAQRADSVFVIDPLGNLMMRYDVRRSPGGLLLDLKKLLGLSSIG